MGKYILNPLCSYNIESDGSILIDTFLKAYRIKSSSQISLLLEMQCLFFFGHLNVLLSK